MIRAITSKKTLLTSFAFISKNKTSRSSPDKYSLTSSLTRKKISYHKSKPRILCLKKTVSLRKSFQSKFPSIIQKNLSKYNTTPTKYNTSIITSIIFDENTHLVSTFKDFLYWDDDGEFLKNYYKKQKQKEKLTNIFYYYSNFYPLYNFSAKYFNVGDCTKVITKFYKNKKKALNAMNQSISDKSDKNSKGNNNIEIANEIEEDDKKHTKLTSLSMTMSTIDIKGIMSRNNNNISISREETIKSLIANMNDKTKKIRKSRIKKITMLTTLSNRKTLVSSKNKITLPTMTTTSTTISTMPSKKASMTSSIQNVKTGKIKLFTSIQKKIQSHSKVVNVCLTERNYKPQISRTTTNSLSKGKNSKVYRSSQCSLSKKKSSMKIKPIANTNNNIVPRKNVKLNLFTLRKGKISMK